MIWKPKEPELTEEEAIGLAKIELAPYWFGSPPLLAGLQTEDSVKVVPLDPDFTKKPRLLYFIDPTDFSGETALVYAKEWFQRFQPLHLESLAVIIPTYEYLKQPAAISSLIEKHSFEFPVVLDHQNFLTPAFRVHHSPCALLFSQGMPFFKHDGSDGWDKTEAEIHHFLRLKDPGLPLLPVFHPPSRNARDRLRYEFGNQPVSGKSVQYPGSGFSEDLGKYRRGRFPTLDPATSIRTFDLSGEWIQNEERIVTLDPEAVVRIFIPGQKFSLIAESMSKTHEESVVSIQLSTSGIYDSLSGEHLELGESGDAIVRVTRPQLYHLFVNLPEEERWVTLRFPDAKRVPIALYGARIGD